MASEAPDESLPALADLISLRGRRALITGGARGIGYSVARRFAEAGAVVLLGDRNVEGAVQAAREISAMHQATVHGMALDVTDSESVAEFADAGVRLFGGIDIWVNNAGVYPGASLLEMTDEAWQQVCDVNLRGTFFGCREAGRRMVNETGRTGRVIVNIASVAAVRGRTGLTHYSAAKSGVLGLTRGAAVELAPHGIRVLVVTPSLAETPGAQEMRRAAQQSNSAGDMLQSMERSIMAAFPMGRAGQPDEIARVVLFCASDLAAFMTGSNVFVDGGLAAR
jgi:NAD(P)-dependent dehydrogenase (short-subunit alcohol dehydrogenase family)